MPDTINNPGLSYGYTDFQNNFWSAEAPFKTSAAITAGKVVAIGTTGLVATAATDGVAALAIGITPRAIASGKVGSVVVMGIAENVNAAGAIAAGDILKRSATTAGFVSATAAAADGEVIGIAINASSSNTVDVWVFPAKVGTTT